jgi:hypothetical protein
MQGLEQLYYVIIFQKTTSTAESRKYNCWWNWSNHQTGRPGKHQISVQ